MFARMDDFPLVEDVFSKSGLALIRVSNAAVTLSGSMVVLDMRVKKHEGKGMHDHEYIENMIWVN